jgi:hypothetical protein
MNEAESLPPITEEDRQFLHYNPNTADVVDWVREYARQAVAAERERCAKVCEVERPSLPGPYCPWSDEDDARYGALTDAAAAIRSGG